MKATTATTHLLQALQQGPEEPGIGQTAEAHGGARSTGTCRRGGW